MARKQIALIAAASLVALTACSSGAGKPKDSALVRVDAERATVPPTALTAAATSANAFGVDVFQAVTDGKSGNVMVSPTSLATVLAMLLPGAKGQTAAEMAKTLHTTLPADQFANALGALNAATVQRVLADKADLQQFDSAWTQQGYDLQQPYLKTLASAFDTGMHEVDFAGSPEAARQTINKAVQDQTNGLIKDLFGPGSLDPSTRLALTDALYFKAKWAETFKKGGTTDVPFHLPDGGTPAVPTMSQFHGFGYAEDTGWQYVELPYEQDHLAMDVVLPAAGTFDSFRKGLTAEKLAAMAGSASEADVDLRLPKFTFDTSLQLKEALAALGMTSVFDASTADLSGIPAKPEPLSVGTVVQKTHVAVDEDGTTAAAASGVSIAAGAARATTKPVTMHVDRPFLFLIRDTVSGQILFLGQVTDPRG
ncbi:serpin family protein [Catenulispora yoronensis]|uniref:Serpin family protein n=1 Tax=Catenulispora yoronensis TaxID=450799 RepID=A0ABP5GFF7_9ACTN